MLYWVAAVSPLIFLLRIFDATLPSEIVQVDSDANLYSTVYRFTVPELGADQVTLTIFGETTVTLTFEGEAIADSTPVSPTPAKVRKTTNSAFGHLKLRCFKACN
jgi:hypothetical protein